MGTSSTADAAQSRSRRRSVRATFAATVAAPAACLALLWTLAAGVILGGGLGWRSVSAHAHRVLIDLTLLSGGGLVVAVILVILAWSFAGRLSRDLSRLAALAGHLGSDQPPAAASGTVPFYPSIAEATHVAEAIAGLRQAAAGAAANETRLRMGLSQVFVSLARRNQSLLQRQLRLIDALEQKAPDSAALADLFALDHLTTRMRRHAESLAVLSGAPPGRSWSDPVPVIDVIREATAEVEDYKRVNVRSAAGEAVAGPAVADMIHLLAELIENATLFSPSGTQVEIRTETVANGFVIEIDDRGLGIDADRLREINQRLVRPPDFDLADADRLGLFVAGKLAARHGVGVSLRRSPYGGITAIVLMPAGIIAGASGASQGITPRRAIVGAPGLAPHSSQSLVHAGRRDTPHSAAVASQPGPAPVPKPRYGQPPQTTGPTPQTTGPTPLPRRTRQANLSPQLAERGQAAAKPAAVPAPTDGHSAEHARDLAASLQNGWRRGRTSEPPADGPAGAAPANGDGS